MKWFRGSSQQQSDPVSRLTDAIERLQAGIVTNLTVEYSKRTKTVDAVVLATCVLSYAIVVDPPSEDALSFSVANRDSVIAESQKLGENGAITQALSYLYAALTILIAIQSRDPLSKAAMLLGNRATDLSIYVPNTYDICGSGDALECIAAIHTFAQTYLNQALGR